MLADGLAGAQRRLVTPVAHRIERGLLENADRLGADDRDIAHCAIGAYHELQIDPSIETALARGLRELRCEVTGTRQRRSIDVALCLLRIVLGCPQARLDGAERTRIRAGATCLGEPAARA